jgi:hypothetical protein
MSTFTGISGHELTFPDDDLPMTSDLEDFSIHEPSGKGRKEGDVMSIDDFIKKYRRYTDSGTEVLHCCADDLREFMKGKVLVDEAALKFALEEINLSIAAGHFRSGACKPNNPMQNERLIRLELLHSVLQQALHPTNTVRDAEAGSGEEV